MRIHHRQLSSIFSPQLISCFVPIVALTACGGGESGIGPPSPGSFGQAAVAPECGAFQQACLSRGLDSPLAVGSLLGLGITFELGGASGPEADLASSDSDVLLLEDGIANSREPGLAVVLIKGPDGRVIDFIHVWSAVAEELRIIRYNDDGAPIGGVRDSGTLLEGDELLVSVEAFRGSQPLIGLFPTQWTVEVLEDPLDTPGEEPIVSVVDDVVFGLFRIVARRPGTVRLVGSALDRETVVELEVLP